MKSCILDLKIARLTVGFKKDHCGHSHFVLFARLLKEKCYL